MSTEPSPALDEMAVCLKAFEARLARLEAGTNGTSASARTMPAKVIEPEIPWTVLAAVVAVVMPEPCRIRSVKVVDFSTGVNWWGLEGRRLLAHSHRIR